jgi:benzoyl-CoA-dihydrodiol lyase
MVNDPNAQPHPPVRFDTDPSRFRHWQLTIEGPLATLAMNVELEGGFRPGYQLKLNSYDLGVDIELADAVRRLRFEHPEVKVVVITSAVPRVFCAGANIRMLAQSKHGFKVNFCKFTNETRCELEDASAHSGKTWIAAVNGACAGGGYELALACDEVYLIDDGSSTVSLPEVPLLGVLPGTGGLTRLVDKRRVRRDVADMFCTKAEGYRYRDALKMGLIEGGWPRSRWEEGIAARVEALCQQTEGAGDVEGIGLEPVERKTTEDDDGVLTHTYRHVTLALDSRARVATLTLAGPAEAAPGDGEALHAMGCRSWALAAFREMDDALLDLRFNHPLIGLILLSTTGDPNRVLSWDDALDGMVSSGHWLAIEIRLHQARVLRRLDNMARSLFALIEPDSCFAGSMFELALSADRIYMLDDPDRDNFIYLHPVNGSAFPTHNGLTRLQIRFLGDEAAVDKAMTHGGPIGPLDAADLGLVTRTPDDLDWEDEVRIAIEERASLSPDALTGMEQNLRAAGAETCDTKVFGRLSAWQNWIFQRPNAVGKRGALVMYGDPEKPVFDWTRT